MILRDLLEKLRSSKVRKVIWPIRSYELLKFVPMALLMFLTLLSYNVVRSIKDSLIMTKIAPEVISFIKLWLEMPAGILIVLLYSFLCNKMSTEKVFRIILSMFLLLFFVFGYIAYPNHSSIHPSSEVVSHYATLYPHLKWFIRLWGQWTFVAFYVLGELWPLVIFSLLFWQLANKITKTEEARRFYSFFSFFGQSNLLISGSIIIYFSDKKNFLSQYFFYSTNPTETMIKSLMCIVLVAGVCCLLLHFFIEKKVMADSRYFQYQNTPAKLELSMKESVGTILKSRYLWLTCILMISYSMSMNLIEGLWFSKVRNYYQTTEKFIHYQGTVLMWTGAFTMVCSLIGSSIIRYLGWFWGAVITPIMIVSVGSIFFIFCLFEHQLSYLLLAITHASPAFIIVFIGGLQNVLGKGTKYSLFDASKEMLYIPLNDELKTKGKAAVEVVGAKIGKSSGAIMQFLIFTIFPNAVYEDLVPFLMTLFIAVCAFWIYGVAILSKAYAKLLEDESRN